MNKLVETRLGEPYNHLKENTNQINDEDLFLYEEILN